MTLAAQNVLEKAYESETVRIGQIEMHVPRHSPHFWGYWGKGYQSSDSDSDSERSNVVWDPMVFKQENWSCVGYQSMECDEWSLDPGDGCY